MTQSVASTRATVRSDGSLLVNGQATFPMGMYHVSWAGNAAKRLRDLNAIANLGFNTVNMTMFDSEGDIAGFTKVLDAAQNRGMKVLIEDFSAKSIASLKGHPATLGWMIADDCNNLVTPLELEKRHRATKALDADHLTYTSMAISFANSHTDYFGRADAVGNQSYPIDGGDAISVVYPVMQKLVAEAAQKGTLPIANLQSFRWENGRYPTAPELNNMTNQALAAGVKGILYYTYLDSTNDLAKYAALNGELKRLNREVKLLTPVLVNGQRRSVTVSGNRQAIATYWDYQGHRYLQVLNPNGKASAKVQFALPAGSAGLSRLLAGRPTTLRAQGGQVSGTLAPLATQWYEVN
ncbi:hypothetical protein [Deinococcus frigens]|uniref:hypothetical protein n=1 Tax=Deinococcus frigens TaxID=249403 RepID=UPI0012EBAF93|nr:hypothetical protein [Deinococcus frigens]